MPLYSSLIDLYDRRDGRTTEYTGVGDNLDIVYPDRSHYDIRAFHSTDLVVPITLEDMKFWNVDYFLGQTMTNLSTRRSISGREYRERTIDEMSEAVDGGGTDSTFMLMSALNQLQQFEIDFVPLSLGNEDWPVGMAGVTIDRDASARYADTLTVDLTDQIEKVIPSYYNDDIDTEFEDPNTNYYIELALPGLQAQSATGRLALSDSYVEFSSDQDFDFDVTDSIPFSASENSLTAGGNTYLSFNRNLLVKCNRKDIRAIRLRLRSTSAIAAPTGVRNTTAGLLNGSLQYVVSYVHGGVESLVSPESLGVVTGVTNPTTNALATVSASAGVLNGYYEYATTFTNASGETLASPIVAVNPALINPVSKQVDLTEIPLSTTGATGRKIYRRQHAMLGKDAIGGTALTVGADTIYTIRATPGASGTISVIKAYVGSVSTGPSNFRAVIYADSAGSPGAILGSSDTYTIGGGTDITPANTPGPAPVSPYLTDNRDVRMTGESVGWTPMTLTTPVAVTAATQYWIGIHATSNVRIYYDALASADKRIADTYADGSVTPFGAGTTDGRQYSFFANIPATWGLVQTIANNSATTVTDNNGAPGAVLPVANTASQQVNLTFALGPSGATARKIYRKSYGTAVLPDGTLYPSAITYPSVSVSGVIYSLVTTIADNTTTTYTDNITALGANAPTTSTLGNITIKARALRLLPGNNYLFEEIDTDTKRNILARSVPRTGLPEPGGIFGKTFFEDSKPFNSRFVVKINAGHNPAPSNDNIIRFYTRWDKATGNHIRFELAARTTQSRLFIYQNIGGADTLLASSGTNTNILTTDEDYYVVFKTGTPTDSDVSAIVYNTNGIFYGTEVYTVASTTTHLGRGYVGYSFEPYNYDFTMDFLSPSIAEFAVVESTPFRSVTPFIGSTLFTNASEGYDLLTDAPLLASGDAVTSVETIGNYPDTVKVVRAGNQWFGGLKSTDFITPGDSRYVVASGYIYPVGQVQGDYRLAMVDKNDSVSYIGSITGILPDQWNEFNVPIQSNLIPDGYYFYIHQTGFYADTFYLSQFELRHDTVSWDSSPDSGANWFPYLYSKDSQYTGVSYLTPTTSNIPVFDRGLKIKGTARSDSAWVQGYQVIPQYELPGTVLTKPGRRYTDSRDVRVVGMP